MALYKTIRKPEPASRLLFHFPYQHDILRKLYFIAIKHISYLSLALIQSETANSVAHLWPYIPIWIKAGDKLSYSVDYFIWYLK